MSEVKKRVTSPLEGALGFWQLIFSIMNSRMESRQGARNQSREVGICCFRLDGVMAVLY